MVAGLIYLSIGLVVSIFTTMQIYVDVVNPFSSEVEDSDEVLLTEEEHECTDCADDIALQDMLVRGAMILVWPAVIVFLLLGITLDVITYFKNRS